MKKRLFSLVLTLLIVLSLPLTARATNVFTVLIDTAKVINKTVKSPGISSIGGDWGVFGLARSGYDVPRSYFENYYKNVESYLKKCEGVLDEWKHTEYSRVILGLTAAGFDPRDVGGYDLTVYLGDYEKTIRQGINGPIFALLALDSAGYEIPHNPNAATQATRELYIEEILSRQLPDGGFALNKYASTSDADITGLALQALAKYQDRADVKAAINQALDCISKMQGSSGGFVSWGEENSESIVQVIVALCELGIGIDDPRFIKNGNSLLDALMKYYIAGKGFEHTIGGGVNQMSTEQALYALAAVFRFESGLTSLYDMHDVGIIAQPETTKGQGLPAKHKDIKIRPVIAQGKTFNDIKNHASRQAIEALAARGIISGKSETSFDPDTTMTRAEFAALLTRGLGLEPSSLNVFSDVSSKAWYSGYVGAAYKYGIISGTSSSTFNPNGLISREEAATMIARAAKLCGIDTELDDNSVRDILARFGDYLTVFPWARGALAFCYKEEVLLGDDLNILPKRSITRCEVAEMLYRMLVRAKLI